MKVLLIICLCLLALIIGYILLLVIAALLVPPDREYEKHSRFYRILLNSATGIAQVLVRIHMHTTGLEQLPKQERFVLVCNHRSKFDPILTWYVLSRYDIAFISKAENFKVPVFGRLIRKCCFLANDRENPKNAMITIQKAAQLIINNQVSIGVYPEGTRSKTLELLPFHNGVFKIAQKAKVPVVIAAIQSTETIKSNYPWHRSHVYLDILETLPVDYVTTHKTSEIGERVRIKIENALQSKEEH